MNSSSSYLDLDGPHSDSSFASLETSSPTPPITYYYVLPANESGYETPSSQDTTTSNVELSNSPLVSNPIVNGQSDVASPNLKIPDDSPEIALTLVFFDLESTGLPRFNGVLNTQITEISFIAVARKDFEKSEIHDLRDVRVINKFSLCVKPRCSVDPHAGKITGLDDAKLCLQHSFDESTAQMVVNFLMHLPQPVCLLAHNGIDFDFPLLKAELHRVGYSLPSTILVADTLLAIRTFDIFGLYAEADNTGRKRKQQRNYKPNSLENLFRHFFRKKPFNSHSSEGDCLSLMMVSHKLKEKILPWIDDNRCLFSNITPMW